MTLPSPAPLPAGLSAVFDTVRPLGAGGMGVVWLVRDRFLDRLVALKVLQADRSGPEERERFLREARTSARLEHPNIINVYRADETDGVVWFSMRFINGESVGDRLRDRGPMPVADTLRVLREVSWGLAYAHARGVVHRDIKPDNILLDRDSGRAVVTDFGISRDAADASKLTMVGNVLGSVHYMSPEQAAGEEVDGRSDVYALGCVAYHMLAGTPPFDGTAQSVLVAHVTKQPPSLTTLSQVPAELALLVNRCLLKNPSERPASADQLASAFDALWNDANARARASADAAPGGVLSENEARVVWQRAAQLQAEAAHRMERRAVLESARVSGEAAVITTDDAYRLRDVEAAAVEAGISRQYVAIALAELRANPSSAALTDPMSEGADRRTTLLMGTADRALSVSRVIQASPKDTLQALGAVFTAAPHEFTLQDTVNGHPLDGGIMRFKVPRFMGAYSNPFAAMSKAKAVRYRLEQIELFDLNVTLQARGTAAAPACEIVVTGDLRAGLRRNVMFDLGIMAAVSFFASVSTAVKLGSMLKVPVLSAAPLIAAAGAAVLGSAAVIIWYRWLFRGALRETYEELGGLLQLVEQQLKTQRLFDGERGVLSSATGESLSVPP
ncbi:serine/threonine-protein kinase [Gemmatimonas sp.]|jgi:hypothetical protein|uniref:serine/threonine-protein kinase n=1 Tax=Gemmatimonas sp. TaxID=1962908 RepID=UPI0037BEDBC5